jgi:hypothetical protein
MCTEAISRNYWTNHLIRISAPSYSRKNDNKIKTVVGYFFSNQKDYCFSTDPLLLTVFATTADPL